MLSFTVLAYFVRVLHGRQQAISYFYHNNILVEGVLSPTARMRYPTRANTANNLPNSSQICLNLITIPNIFNFTIYLLFI